MAVNKGRQEIQSMIDTFMIRPREDCLEAAHRLYRLALQQGFTKGRRVNQARGGWRGGRVGGGGCRGGRPGRALAWLRARAVGAGPRRSARRGALPRSRGCPPRCELRPGPPVSPPPPTPQVAASCLYIICRQEDKPFMLIDYSDLLQVRGWGWGWGWGWEWGWGWGWGWGCGGALGGGALVTLGPSSAAHCPVRAAPLARTLPPAPPPPHHPTTPPTPSPPRRRQVNVFTLGAVYVQLLRLLRLEDHPTFAKPTDPSLYLHRFCTKLALGRAGDPTDGSEAGARALSNAVTNTAMRLLSSMKRDWMQTGRRPSGVCGAALFLACHIHGAPRTKRDIMQVGGGG
jgi:hypothetical protein